jgi:Flp pilus assembly protein TadD
MSTPTQRPPEQLCRDGIELAGLGRLEEAEACFRELVRLRPEGAEGHNLLGVVLNALGRRGESAAHYREALRLRPDFAAAHANLADSLREQGLLAEAVASYERALGLDPDSAESSFGLGNALLAQGQFAGAVACYGRTLTLRGDDPDVLNNLGTALWEDGQIEEAESRYRQALRLRPGDFAILTNLGNALREQGRAEEAAACYRRALELRGDSPETRMNLGVVLSDLGELDAAATLIRQALGLRPDWPAAIDNLGTTLLRQGRHEEALAAFERALELSGDYAEAHRNRAMLRLARGDFERGWPEYEWRWRCRGRPTPSFRQPRWQGEDLAGRTILLHAEQGLGDTLQFLRYAPLVGRRGGRVLVVCPQPLVRLAALCPCVERVLPAGSALPGFDVQASLLSLPMILGTTLATIPASLPYLSAPPEAIERWGQALGPRPEATLRVGIAWQGNPRHRSDRYRSFPLAKLAPLARVAGVELISLQTGSGTDQLDDLAGRLRITAFGPAGAGLGDFLDTAALVRNLDLVVTPDTVVAHLAGGLGVPTWVALPHVAEWRWLLDRDDSPWYPSMRLFRQARAGDWDGVFERMAASLERHVVSRESRPWPDRPA